MEPQNILFQLVYYIEAVVSCNLDRGVCQARGFEGGWGDSRTFANLVGKTRVYFEKMRVTGTSIERNLSTELLWFVNQNICRGTPLNEMVYIGMPLSYDSLQN